MGFPGLGNKIQTSNDNRFGLSDNAVGAATGGFAFRGGGGGVIVASPGSGTGAAGSASGSPGVVDANSPSPFKLTPGNVALILLAGFVGWQLWKGK